MTIPRFTCRLCGFTTKADSELREHKRLKECEPYITPRNHYYCCNCGRDFPTAGEARACERKSHR